MSDGSSSSSSSSSNDIVGDPSLMSNAERSDHDWDSSIGDDVNMEQLQITSSSTQQQQEQEQQRPSSLSVDPSSLVVPAAYGLPWESPDLWVCGPDLARRSAFEDGLHLFSLASLAAVLASLAASPSMPQVGGRV